MKYLPFENITYTTKLDSEEILNRLNNIIEPRKTFRNNGIFGGGHHKPYEGSINGASFSVTRIINYRNSFLPKINGAVEKDLDGTKINVRMRLHLFVIIFMAIWLIGVGIGCLAFIFTMLDNNKFEPMIFIPFGMLLFGYALVTGGFKYESKKTKKDLAQLFESETPT